MSKGKKLKGQREATKEGSCSIPLSAITLLIAKSLISVGALPLSQSFCKPKEVVFDQ